jgi:hypothetical protein
MAVLLVQQVMGPARFHCAWSPFTFVIPRSLLQQWCNYLNQMCLLTLIDIIQVRDNPHNFSTAPTAAHPFVNALGTNFSAFYRNPHLFLND